MNRDIKFLRVTYLRGPNIWTYRPVIEAWVDIGDLEDAPSNTLPGFPERLAAWLPSLIEHRCGVGERGGFLARLREGTWAAHILEHVVIELQNLAGLQTGFGKARETGQRGIYKLAVRARNEQVGRAALAAGRELLLAAMEDRPYDVAAAVAGLRDLVDDYYLGPSTACIVDAAVARRIPWLRLNEGNLVQLGQGARQRRIWTAETECTSAIAEGIAGDKDLTKELLAACGVPVPAGRLADSPEDAWDAAEDIGLPVVVKPVDGNHGRGVSLDLRSRADVEAAWRLARAEGSEVLVERSVPGDEHRLLVVGGRLVAAAKGEVARVVGDGVSSIETLIDQQINSDPRRGSSEEFPLNRLRLDEDPAVVLELARQGLAPGAVPEAGRSVLIQRNGNVAHDCTDRVHPEVAALVASAARVVGLDIAGIDLVAEDISRPLAEQGGAIVEVNAGPGLLMHLKPASGQPRAVGPAIVDHLFPAGDDGRIPIVGICGSQGATRAARLLACWLILSGKRTGLACADGLYLDKRRVEAGDRTDWHSGQRLLINRGVQVAVLENGAATILREGLAYDRCQVGVVTGLDDPAGLTGYYIQSEEQVYNVLRTQVDVVREEGAAVLNAEDERVLDMARLCDGEVILYARDENLPALLRHRAAGGRVVCPRAGRLLFARGDVDEALIDRLVPAGSTVADQHLQAVLAAAAAAWALDVPLEVIRAGVEASEAYSGESADAPIPALCV